MVLPLKEKRNIKCDWSGRLLGDFTQVERYDRMQIGTSMKTSFNKNDMHIQLIRKIKKKIGVGRFRGKAKIQ